MTAPSRDPAAVRAMFGRIAPSYDLANHLLSGGIDFWWRHQAAQIAAGWQPSRLLDLATGSGDLALAIQRKSPTTEITAADVSREMLAVAREKGVKNTVVADALDLPFNDNCFDAVTVAFGLRNMADWDAAVSEMARVLTIDGNLLVLDFSLPAGLLGGIYRTYLHRCLPALAGLVTGERDAYSYLGASIENFPSGTGMINLLERHGFVAAKARALTGGVASIYLARKPNVS